MTTPSETRKTAFVTGSGRNIGRAIVLEMARRGCNVVVNGSSNQGACEAVAEEARSVGVGAIVTMGNIGDNLQVQAMAILLKAAQVLLGIACDAGAAAREWNGLTPFFGVEEATAAFRALPEKWRAVLVPVPVTLPPKDSHQNTPTA